MTVQEMARAFLELTAADEAELRAKAAAEMNRAKPLPTTADHIFTLPRRTHDPARARASRHPARSADGGRAPGPGRRQIDPGHTELAFIDRRSLTAGCTAPAMTARPAPPCEAR